MAKNIGAKRTGTRSTKARKPKQNASRFEPLVPDSKEIVVRMYRQGLGDCFLLALPTGESRPKYVLIDCGVHKRQTDGPPRLAQVLENLGKATGSHIDIVVATHEHADHLSGFVQKGSPFLANTLTFGEVWLAWTEKRGDRQADTLRRKRGTAQRIIDKAVKEARERAGRGLDGPALAKHLDDLMDFDHPAEGSVDEAAIEARVDALSKNAPTKSEVGFVSLDEPQGLGATKTAATAKPSSNELALRLLALTAGDNKTKYCEPGDVCVIDDVPDLRAYVLGPPRSDLLEQEKPTKIRGAREGDPGGIYKEVYLTATGGNRALALTPRFLSKDAPADDLLPEDWRYPFASRYQRRYELTIKPDNQPAGGAAGADAFEWNQTPVPVPTPTQSLIAETYLDPDATWRRIDGDWLNAAGPLALDLAGDTNNSSLVLAFEWGPRGRGRVLLFAADAQVGNWLSWRDQTYGERKLKVDSLLDRVLLYKVGHHGSHNATVRRDPRDSSSTDPLGAPFGLELMHDIIAMIPVDYDAVKKEMPDPWKMPHEPLYRRLREKAGRRVMRSDLELTPLVKSRDQDDVVPEDENWKPVPGLPGVRWRKSKDTFDKGTKGPLYYEVAIALRD